MHVELLFGLYNYSFALPLGREDEQNLVILYGENGSGKTTILRLLYHLLSPEDNKGHRTALAQIPFRRFAVILADDTQVVAFRPAGNVLGEYRMHFVRSDRTKIEAVALVSSDGSIRESEWPAEYREKWSRFIQELQGLKLSLHFLSENRQASLSASGPSLSDITLAESDPKLLAMMMEQRRAGRRDQLVSAIERFEQWVTSEALKGSTVGEASINTLYSDIVKRIAQSGLRAQAEERDPAALLDSIRQLEVRSRSFAQLGLAASLNLIEMQQSLAQSHAMARTIVAGVIGPYLDALRARFEALEPIRQLLTAFLTAVNGFFSNKSVEFDTKRGLTIRSATRDRLLPSMLSSGERQLLLLFCNTAVARASGTVLIIDEPELSLNIKWQRQLIDALLQLVAGAPVQFVLATHSIELLTAHREFVWRLDSPKSSHGG